MRYCLCTGVDRHGERKFRAIDDMSRSLINEATGANEKLICETLDIFHKTLMEAERQLGVRQLDCILGLDGCGCAQYVKG